MLKPFLTANWRYLAMLDFAVDPKILAPHVPAGTELDFHNDKTYLSVVGFLFYHAKPRRSIVTNRVLYRVVENPTPIQPDGK
jgi:uncharacterized protein YqjF (DUF2071 family)